MIGPKAALTVPLPLPIDEEYLSSGTVPGQPINSRQTLVVQFYVLSLKLSEIMHTIIANFHSVGSKSWQSGDNKPFRSLSEGLNLIFEIERRLSAWVNSVPDRLRMTTSDKPQSGSP